MLLQAWEELAKALLFYRKFYYAVAVLFVVLGAFWLLDVKKATDFAKWSFKKVAWFWVKLLFVFWIVGMLGFVVIVSPSKIKNVYLGTLDIPKKLLTDYQFDVLKIYKVDTLPNSEVYVEIVGLNPSPFVYELLKTQYDLFVFMYYPQLA